MKHLDDKDDGGVAAVAAALIRRRPDAGVFIVGVTGSVAAGKSTLAHALAAEIRGWVGTPRVEIIGTDGFLLPNPVLAERGLEARKGFPESYDINALAATLGRLRRKPTPVPVYSHTTYDIDPAAERMLDPPEILLVEGLALGLERVSGEGSCTEQAAMLDALIYLDASERDLEAWFVARFVRFWAGAKADPASFYARFGSLDREGAAAMARWVWTSINLPNLRTHIAPVREFADIVAVKAGDHRIVELRDRLAPA